MAARLMNQHGVEVAHQPTATLRTILSNPKRRVEPLDQANVTYKIECGDCEKHYVGQTGKKLSTRLREHQVVVKRHDQLFLVSVHEDSLDHKIDFGRVSVLDHGSTRYTREFLEAWHSNQNSINRHIKLNPTYIPLQVKDKRKANSR